MNRHHGATERQAFNENLTAADINRQRHHWRDVTFILCELPRPTRLKLNSDCNSWRASEAIPTELKSSIPEFMGFF